MSERALKDSVPSLPDDYDPAQGLKKLAVAEAAENHFKRARDASALCEAVEKKLGEQRRFVLWWDGQENKGGNPTVTGLQRLEDYGIDRTTVHRWRKRLKDPKKFDSTLQAAQERCVKVCEARQGQSDYAKATNTGENDWHTPAEYLDVARRVLGGFALDPASSKAAQQRVGAERFFTPADDGLSQDWKAPTVWLNPPYAQPYIAEFVSKLVAEVQNGNVGSAILLTHNYTDTAWFHQAAGACSLICFTRGRIKFINAKGQEAAPTQGQTFFYFGADPEIFAQAFSEIGFVARPA